MSDQATRGTTDAHILSIERGSVAEQRRACDAVTRPDDPALAARLASALVGLLGASEVSVKTASLRALRRVVLARDASLDAVLAAVLTSALDDARLVRGAAIDVLLSRMADDESARRVVRAGLTAAVGRHASRALRLVRSLGRELLEQGALRDDERALLDAIGALLGSDGDAHAAAAALGELGTRASTTAPALLVAIDARDPEAALAALRTLLQIAPDASETSQAFERAMAWTDPARQRGALESCFEALQSGASVGGHLSTDRLRGHLTSGETSLIAPACDLLGHLGDGDDSEALLALLESTDWPTRAAAHDALDALNTRGQLSVDRLLTWADRKPRASLPFGLHFLGAHAGRDERVIERLVHLSLNGWQETHRQAATEALRPHASDAVRHRFAAMLSPQTPIKMRRRAIEALLAVGPRMEHQAILVECLRDPSASVRNTACLALHDLIQSSPEAISPAVFPGLVRRFVDEDTTTTVYRILTQNLHLAPPAVPVATLLKGASSCWKPLFEEAFGQPRPDAHEWQALFTTRIRWWAKLLHHDSPALPDDPGATGETMVAMAREHHNHRQSPSRDPDDHGADRERAWALATAWRQAIAQTTRSETT